MFHAAILLAHVNILIKLAPEAGRSFYIAAFNTIIGFSVAAATHIRTEEATTVVPNRVLAAQIVTVVRQTGNASGKI